MQTQKYTLSFQLLPFTAIIFQQTLQEMLFLQPRFTPRTPHCSRRQACTSGRAQVSPGATQQRSILPVRRCQKCPKQEAELWGTDPR